jgi:hypothetical protein
VASTSVRARLLAAAGWPSPRDLAATVLILGLLAIYAWRFLIPVFAAQPPRADDFQDYLYAARQITSGGDPYGDFIRNHLTWDWSLSSGYLYPPAFAILLVPLTWISNDLAVRLWLLLIQAAVLTSLVVVYRTIGRPRRGELLAVTLAVTTFFPIATSVWSGAMNSVLLLLLTIAWALWLRQKDVAGGVIAGVAAVIKVFPVALLPYFLFRRNWRLAVAMLITGVAGIGLGFLVTSPAHNLYYFGDMLPHLSAGTGYRENQSLAGLAARLCDPSTVDHAGSAGWCGRALAWPADAVVLALILVATRRQVRSGLEFGLAVCALPLVSSVTWSFPLVLLVLPIALLLRDMSSRPRSGWERRAVVLAWACFAVGPAFHYALIIHPLTGFFGVALTRLLDESLLSGTVLLFGLLWIAVRRIPAAASTQVSRLAA